MAPYDKTVWVNNQPPPINADNLNKIEQGIADAEENVGEGHITIFTWMHDAIGQGTWVFVSLAEAWADYLYRQSSPADGDNLTYKVYLAKGTYSLRLFCLTGSANGIIDVDIDATEVASFDTYSASVVNVATKTQTNISVASSGLKTLKLRVDGKNASSTDYYMQVYLLALWRTA